MKKILLVVLVSGTIFTLFSGFDSRITKKELLAENEQLKVELYDYRAKNDVLQRENDIYVKSVDSLLDQLATSENKVYDLSKELESFKKHSGSFSNMIKYYDLSFEIQAYTYAMSLEYDLDYALLLAIIHKESTGKVDAVNQNSNGTTDSGLMQINSVNHNWLCDELGIRDFFNPYQNIRAGAFILRSLFNKYDDVHQVLMAYNMGESRMKELVSQGIYSSKYSRAVVNEMDGN